MPAIKHKMQSLLERGKSFLTPTTSSANFKGANGFSTAKSETLLFPQTDPSVDGDECQHDCSSCTVHLPSKFSIDEDDKLYGHVKGWDTHLIVGTGKTDWVRDVTDETGTVMEAVGKFGQEIQMSNGRGKGKVMLSASNMPTGGQHGDCDNDEGADCLMLPSWTMIEKVQPDQVPDLMREVIGKSATNKSPLSAPKSEPQTQANSTPELQPQMNGSTDTTTKPHSEQNGTTETEEPDISALTLTPTISRSLKPPTQFKTKSIPHSALILMCSHRTRDARCGQSAPLLRKEFERHLRPLGLYRDLHDERPGGVGIYFINHVGGHKYSANVMIYRRAGSIRANNAADIVIMVHPDYQYTPQLILPMCSVIANGVYPVMFASRILGGGALRGGMPMYKYIFNRMLTLFENILLGQKLSEYHTGYRAFSADVIRAIDFSHNSDDFVFDNEMISQIFMAGYEIGEVTCPTKYFEEASSINFSRSAKYGMGVLRVSLTHRLHKWGLIKSKLYRK